MPPQTQTNQTPVSPPQPYMQSRVQYMGITVFSGSLALLEWSADGHIRLWKLDPNTNQATEIIIDCLPNQIEKASTSLSRLKLRVNGKNHNLDFSSTATNWLITGGVLGLFMANKRVNESGIQWWVDNLKAQGVHTTQFGVGSLLKIVLIVFGIVFGLSLLIAIVGGLSS